jgi:hypothetical protein
LAVIAGSCDERLQLKVAEADALWQNKLDLEITKARLDLQAYNSQVELLKRELDLAIPPWYARPVFVASATAIITLTLGGLILWGAIAALGAM